MGTTWDGCHKKLDSQGRPVAGSEDAVTRQLYSVAWENFRADPKPFFQRLREAVEEFATDFPDVIWKGCEKAFDEPGWLFPNLLAAISLFGLLYGAVRSARAA
jgi:hypothetical protein